MDRWRTRGRNLNDLLLLRFPERLDVRSFAVIVGRPCFGEFAALFLEHDEPELFNELALRHTREGVQTSPGNIICRSHV